MSIELRGIDLNLLVTLDALLAEANVTRAAQRLHLSQSAVSGQLARLRTLLDDPLLLPAEHGRGMVPTARALGLAASLRAALGQLAAVVQPQTPFDPVSATRTFQVAASDLATATFGLPLVRMLARCAGPGVRLAFRHADSARIASQMEAGDVDLLLGSERMVPPSMRARVLLREHFVMVQRKGHPRGAVAPGLDAYCALPQVLVSTSGGSLHGFMDEHLEQQGRARTVALSVQSFLLVPRILCETDYAATVPSRLAALHADVLDALPLPFDAAGFTLHAAWHPRAHTDPGLAWLRARLIEVADTTHPV